jgi:dTDP-4-amino-4,6-dideoxygalactose transaminase
MKVPLSRIHISGREVEYINDAITRGKISADGHYTKKVNEFFETEYRARKALMTTSCTHAIEMACLLMGLKPGDEVILPSFTFVSSANPVLLRGARPVFAEILSDTMNIDPQDVERKITNKTKAIFPVHYAGVSCQMDELMELADKNDLYVVEDAAHAINARYKGRPLGTVGDFGCLSFHETKNIVCGEGGELLINTDDKKIHETAEIIREKGTNRSKFFRGEVDKYTWVMPGSSYVPSDILAAYLWAQLENMHDIQRRRQAVYDTYHRFLKPYEDEGILRRPIIPGFALHNAHIYYVLLHDEEARNRLMDKLRAAGVQAIYHYLPLHSSPQGMALGYKKEDFPITQMVGECLLRLPIYPGMSEEEMQYVLSNLEKSLEGLNGE